MAKNLVLAKAQNAILSHDWTTAARLYKELLHGNESNVEYLKELGSIYVKAGEDEKAIPYYQQIITYYPHYIEAMNSLGAIYRRLKRYDESIAILQKAKDEGRDSASVNYNMGFTYKEMGKYDEAIESFESVINENPDDVLAYNHLGSIYYSQKNYEKSITSYRRGLQVDPNHPILNYNLARCYEDSKNIPDAIRCYEAALKTRPGWKDAIRDFSELLIKGQKNKEAQDLVEKSIKLHPTDGDLLCILGRIFLNQFDYENASLTFKKADSVKPNDIKILTGFSKALERGDKVPEALEKALEACELAPEDTNSRLQYAHALLSAQRYEQAFEQVKILDNDTNGKDPQVLDLYGQYYICRGDEGTAKEYYEKIKQLNHHYKNYMLEASDRYAQIGDLDKSKEYAEKYVERCSQSPEGYYRLGNIAFARGDMKTAKEEYEKSQHYALPNKIAENGLKKVNAELSKNPALMDYETPSIEVDAEKVDVEEEDYIPESFKGEVVGHEEEDTEPGLTEEFDYEQMGDDVPMGEALLEKEGNFWEDFDDDEHSDSEGAEEEEIEEEEEDPVNMVMTNPDTGLPYDDFRGGPENSDSEDNGDQLLDALANSGDDAEFSPDDIDENSENLDDIARSLPEDSDDFDFGDFEDADANNPIEDAESNQPQMEASPENTEIPESSPLSEQSAPVNEKPNIPETPAYNQPDPYADMRNKYQQPAYDPTYDRQMQAAAMNNAGNAMEAAFMAQRMVQQLTDQQKQFEEKLTLKNEQMIHDAVEKAVDEKIQKNIDQQMEKIMAAEKEEDIFADIEEYVPEETSPVEEEPAVEDNSVAEETPAEAESSEELSDEPFCGVEDFAEEETPAVEEEPAVVEETPVVEEPSVQEELSNEPFAELDDFIDEEIAEEEPLVAEETPAEAESSEELSDEPFCGVEDFAEEEEAPAVVEETPVAEEPSVAEELSSEPFAELDEFVDEESPYQRIVSEIEEKLRNQNAEKDNADQIELFKSLKALSSFMPDNQNDSYVSCKIRMVLDYLIAKLSGKPGLLITAEALLESGFLGEEYSSKLSEESDEYLSNDLIKHVLTYMKELAGQLEDSSLSEALCASADNILEKIEIENSKSQIF